MKSLEMGDGLGWDQDLLKTKLSIEARDVRKGRAVLLGWG